MCITDLSLYKYYFISGKISKGFTVSTGTIISDLTFHPAPLEEGYDLFLTSQDKDSVLVVNLASGKVETISGMLATVPLHSILLYSHFKFL